MEGRQYQSIKVHVLRGQGLCLSYLTLHFQCKNRAWQLVGSQLILIEWMNEWMNGTLGEVSGPLLPIRKCLVISSIRKHGRIRVILHVSAPMGWLHVSPTRSICSTDKSDVLTVGQGFTWRHPHAVVWIIGSDLILPQAPQWPLKLQASCFIPACRKRKD